MARAGETEEPESSRELLRDFAAALRAARERHAPKITQGTVAETLGVSQALVSQWEAGQKEPSRETVFALEELLDLAPGILSRKLGYLPVSWDSKRKRMSFEEFIEVDVKSLSPAEKNILIDLYKQFTGS